MNIVVKNQAEWDALPKAFKEFTVIEIRSEPSAWLSISKTPDNSRVEAWESSSVVAWGSSSVVAWGSSSVVARGSSRVEAWESSSVVARESSSVVAWGAVSVHVQTTHATITIAAFAVAILLQKCAVARKSKTCKVITVKAPSDTQSWADWDGAQTKAGKIILFKRVSKDFKTQEGTPNETLWKIGATLTHKNWNPKGEECGAGKYHACSFASACDQFRDAREDRYIALEAAIKDTFFWKNGSHPHKIAFRKAKVLHECNRWGEKIGASAQAQKGGTV